MANLSNINNKFLVTTGGNVGIGTTSPQGALHVYSGSSERFLITGDVHVQGSTDLNINGTSRRLSFTAGTGTVRTTTGNNLYLQTNSTTVLELKSNLVAEFTGNVGIGTGSPLDKVHSVGGYLSTGLANPSNTNTGSVQLGYDGTRGILRTWNSSPLQLNAYNNIEFYTIGSERMRIDSSGNVGIGTTSPSVRTHIYDSSTDAVLYIDSGNANGSHARFLASGSVKHFIGSGGGFGLGDVDDFALRAFDNLIFATNNTSTERMRIASNGDTTHIASYGGGTFPFRVGYGSYSSFTPTFVINDNGNVGIDTTSPTAKLEVVCANGANAFRANFGGSADIFMGFDNANPYLLLQDNSNVTTHLFQSNVNNYIVGSNVGIGVTNPSFKTHFRGGSNTEETVLKLDKSSYGDTGGHTTILGFGNEPAGWAKGGIGYERTTSYDRGKMHFLQENTGNSDTVTLADSVMTIQPNGNVGIGTTSPNYKLDVNGEINASDDINTTNAKIFASKNGDVAGIFNRNTSTGNVVLWRYANTQVGSVVVNLSSTIYLTSSDYRLKKNIVEMTGALDRVNQLKPKRFNFIADENTTVDGFLAHEVQDIVPEAIHGTKDEIDEEGNPVYQGIDQSKLVPLLVGAIQELQKRIEILENK